MHIANRIFGDFNANALRDFNGNVALANFGNFTKDTAICDDIVTARKIVLHRSNLLHAFLLWTPKQEVKNRNKRNENNELSHAAAWRRCSLHNWKEHKYPYEWL